LFDRLFSAGGPVEKSQSRAKREAEQKSILDLVSGDAKRLRRQLGGDDAHKLDEYLSGVREIEQRLDQPEDDLYVDGRMTRPRGIPAEYSRHVRLMGDLITVAFQSDLTRVATLMFANEGSRKTYPAIGIREGHHDLSHHQNKPEKQEKIARINRFHIDQLAYVLGRLESVREGEGTLLDNTMLVYGSGISDGNAHNHENLPVLVAGGGRGAIKGGRHVRYANETPLMNLYISMLKIAGVEMNAMGDSTGPLKGLDA
jgi:hypothetical protein